MPFSVSLDAFIWESLMAPDSIPRGRGTVLRKKNIIKREISRLLKVTDLIIITLRAGSFQLKAYFHMESVISIKFNKTPNT